MWVNFQLFEKEWHEKFEFPDEFSTCRSEIKPSVSYEPQTRALKKNNPKNVTLHNSIDWMAVNYENSHLLI